MADHVFQAPGLGVALLSSVPGTVKVPDNFEIGQEILLGLNASHDEQG